jgi:hypothetical protein
MIDRWLSLRRLRPRQEEKAKATEGDKPAEAEKKHSSGHHGLFHHNKK